MRNVKFGITKNKEVQEMKVVNYRIQRRNNLNKVVYEDIEGPGGGRHHYTVERDEKVLCDIQFQNGPRNEEGSIPGVVESDLLEVVRSRLQFFQAGPYASRENAVALTKVEEALMWMNKRTEDRAERGVLGTMNK